MPLVCPSIIFLGLEQSSVTFGFMNWSAASHHDLLSLSLGQIVPPMFVRLPNISHIVYCNCGFQ